MTSMFFWLTLTQNFNCSVESGIYWNHKTESGWQAEQNLKPGADSFGYGMERDIARYTYFFDVTLVNDEDIVLVWAEYTLGSSGSASGILSQRQYDGNWTPQNDIETGNVLGVKLSRDSTGVLHLVYWLRGDEWWNDVWGNLMHRTSVDGVTWSAPTTIDSGGNAACPWMEKDNQRIYLVWERNLGSQVIPVWKTYMNGAWGSAHSLSIKPGMDAWYPTAEPLSNGFGIAWSSRSADRVAIETTIISAPENSFVNPAIYLLLLE